MRDGCGVPLCICSGGVRSATRIGARIVAITLDNLLTYVVPRGPRFASFVLLSMGSAARPSAVASIDGPVTGAFAAI